MKLRDLFGDKELRSVLILAFLIATAILIATKADHNPGHVVIEYLHELAMAILVALPILITIELFNQRRHALALDTAGAAPDGFKVMLDSLHQADMRATKPRSGYRYAWLQEQGLVQGQGAMLRWEVDRTQLTGGAT